MSIATKVRISSSLKSFDTGYSSPTPAIDRSKANYHSKELSLQNKASVENRFSTPAVMIVKDLFQSTVLGRFSIL
jgi:hypothetical protein